MTSTAVAREGLVLKLACRVVVTAAAAAAAAVRLHNVGAIVVFFICVCGVRPGSRLVLRQYMTQCPLAIEVIVAGPEVMS
jgi:hypothetical protein